jgi:hypothetical protein
MRVRGLVLRRRLTLGDKRTLHPRYAARIDDTGFATFAF